MAPVIEHTAQPLAVTNQTDVYLAGLVLSNPTKAIAHAKTLSQNSLTDFVKLVADFPYQQADELAATLRQEVVEVILSNLEPPDAAPTTPADPRLRKLVCLVLSDPLTAIDYADSLEDRLPDLVRAVAAFNPLFADEMARTLKFELIETLKANL